MGNSLFIPNRRKFLGQSLTLAFSFLVFHSIARLSELQESGQNDKIPPLGADVVYEFVVAAHGNPVKVKEMLSKEPMIANACWDWGGGDFETALGGASHMGNRDIANYLLDNNARIDIFCAAMLGYEAVVESLIKMKPGIVNVSGPHKFPFLYHVAISGEVGIADLVKPYLNKDTIAGVCNSAVHAAVREGHESMIEWLFANGADDPNTKDFKGRSPLQIAEEKGHKEIVLLLKKHGGK